MKERSLRARVYDVVAWIVVGTVLYGGGLLVCAGVMYWGFAGVKEGLREGDFRGLWNAVLTGVVALPFGLGLLAGLTFTAFLGSAHGAVVLQRMAAPRPSSPRPSSSGTGVEIHLDFDADDGGD